MKRLLAATLATALLAGTAAQAAHTITFAPPAANGSFSGTFGNTAISAGAFSDTFNFTMPTGVAAGTISSNFSTDQLNNIDFTAVTLNGTAFSVGSTGQTEFRSLNSLPVTSGTQTLVVSGSSGGNASYSGTLAFTPTVAVPEPATWAMMITGFGGVGALLRRKRLAATAAMA